MKIDQSIIEAILNKISMVDVVSQYVNLNLKGNKYWGCCPFHNEKTPSFSITPEKNLFFCFGCQKGGNLIHFIQEVEHMSFVESVELLAKKAGVEIPKDGFSKTFSEEEKKKDQFYQLYQKVADLFHYFLFEKKSSPEALKYLEGRKISDETLKKFNIGYAPSKGEWLYDFLLSKNYSKEFLRESGLFSAKKESLTIFYNRIIFPVRDIKGRTIAFSGRTLADNGPKYINSPETIIYKKKENLFGLYEGIKEIRNKKNLFIVEGNFDVLAMHDAGVENAVAPLGTAFTENQALILKKYIKSAKLFFDPDEAGLKAAEKTIYILQQQGIDAEIVDNFGSSDPSEIIEKNGKEGLKKTLNYSINSFEYLLKKYQKGIDITDYTNKEQIIRSLFKFIAGQSSEIRKDGLLTRVADEFNVNKKALELEFKKYVEGEKRLSFKPNRPVEKKIMLNSSIEMNLLLVSIANPKYFKEVRRYLPLEEIEDEMLREMYIALEESYRSEEMQTFSILNNIESDELRDFLTKKISEKADEIANMSDNNISSLFYTIKMNKLRLLKEKFLKDCSRYELEGDVSAQEMMLNEIRCIDEEINNLGKINDRD
ncbi:MAG: DNA primase [Spirochaetales bacterium]|nr:DNA primase [Spirochaetales bacterium]